MPDTHGRKRYGSIDEGFPSKGALKVIMKEIEHRYVNLQSTAEMVDGPISTARSGRTTVRAARVFRDALIPRLAPSPAQSVLFIAARRNGGLLVDGRRSIASPRQGSTIREIHGVMRLTTWAAANYAETPLFTIPSRFFPGQRARTPSFRDGCCIGFRKFGARAMIKLLALSRAQAR